MHRDIKPENIVFSCSGEPKLTDFGFACHLDKSLDWLDSVGSPLFMSPEMIYGRYGLECDVWSMGVLIFYMVSGSHPYDGETIAEIHSCILQQRYKLPEVSKQCTNIVGQMLEYRNDLRPKFKELITHQWYGAKTQ